MAWKPDGFRTKEEPFRNVFKVDTEQVKQCDHDRDRIAKAVQERAEADEAELEEIRSLFRSCKMLMEMYSKPLPAITGR